MQFVEFPCDFFLKIDDNDYFVVRITVNKFNSKFSTEIDIVNKESKKIYKHIDALYDFTEPQEALNQSVEHTSSFLRSLKF